MEKFIFVEAIVKYVKVLKFNEKCDVIYSTVYPTKEQSKNKKIILIIQYISMIILQQYKYFTLK